MLIDMKSFFEFLKENHIVATVVATVISSYITKLTNSLTDDILLPILNRDGDGDGESDIKKYEEIIFEFYKIKFKIGSFVMHIFKFVIMTYLMFLLSKTL